jgi:abhydrolase domain-containing protein 17
MGCSASTSADCYDRSVNSLIFEPPNFNHDIYCSETSSKQLVFCQRQSQAVIKKVAMYIITPFYKKDKPKKWIVWSHGNGCTICGMSNYLENVADQLNCGVVVYDYQGYGLSSGKPSEENCYDDINSVIEYMKEDMQINTKDILLIGHSLGTGITVEYAVRSEWINPIILISPYCSMVEIGVGILGILPTSSVSCLGSSARSVSSIDRFVTIDKVKKLKCPVKLYHGMNDTLIPMSHSLRLWSLISDKSLQPTYIRHGDHENLINIIQASDIGHILNSF